MKRPRQEVVTLDFQSEQIDASPALGILRADTQDVRALAINPTETTRSAMIVPQPWSGFGERRDSLMYHGMIANRLNVLALAIDNPGVGSGVLSHQDRIAVAGGDFSMVAERQWQVINRLIETDPHVESPDATFAYSLGAVAASALIARAPEGVRFERIMLLEAVGISDVSFRTLLQRFAAEQFDWGKYKKENTPEVKELQAGVGRLSRQLWQERQALLAYGRASTHATVVPNLEEARKRGVVDKDTEITIVSGTKSRVSPVGLNIDLAWHFAERGLNTRQLLLENESHGLIDSIGRIAALMSYLRES